MNDVTKAKEQILKAAKELQNGVNLLEAIEADAPIRENYLTEQVRRWCDEQDWSDMYYMGHVEGERLEAIKKMATDALVELAFTLGEQGHSGASIGWTLRLFYAAVAGKEPTRYK